MAKKLKKKVKKPLSKAGDKEGEVEKVSTLKRTKIRVIGIGGGGGNIVSELAQGVKRASFFAANTDMQALKEISRKVERFPFGQSFTRGLGTGMNLELAETAGQNEKERIKKILQGQDLVILIASLGGGTGSGAAPIFAKISKSLGNLTYGIFTLPFKFEGEKKMEIAKSALDNLRPKLNSITILPNERIFQVVDKTTPLKAALSSINKNLATALGGLIETIYQPGLINIDFADLRTVLQGQGRLAYLNTISLPKKEGTAKDAVEKALISPLYPYGIKGAKGILFNIIGEKGISLEEVNQISKTISEKVNPEAKIVFGIQPLSSRKETGHQNIIKTTVFATGCVTKVFSDKTPKKRSKGRAKKPPRIKKRKIAKKVNLKPEPSKKTPQNKAVKKVKPIRKPQKKTKKTKTKTSKKFPRKRPRPKIEAPKENPESFPSQEKKITEAKVRKSALQIKKEVEEVEEEMLEKEKFWETPSFLRQKKN
ncbi:MAG TPA: cell division protein FtsZ [Candidatus Humimicrobiaceae bacterium]|nr:cell division protein FtsZ [Candidatus Humimicrobiaceae bacterium]